MANINYTQLTNTVSQESDFDTPASDLAVFWRNSVSNMVKMTFADFKTMVTGFSPYINVKDNSISNLAGDGVTDDSAAFDALIDGASVGDTLFFPNGTYLINNVTGSKRVNLLGEGNAIIQNTTDNYTFWPYNNNAAAYGFYIDNLKFVGDDTAGSSNRGLYLRDIRDFHVRNCSFDNFTDGLLCWDTVQPGGASAGIQGGTILDCVARNCTRGIWLFRQAEYISIIGGVYDNNTTAIDISSGNDTVVGANINYNTTGIYLGDESNNSHGVVSACKMNHNTTAIQSDGVDFGFIFEGCHMWANTAIMDIDNTEGLVFNSCSFSDGTVNIDGSTVVFNMNQFRTGNLPTFTVATSTVTYDSNKLFNGTVYTP